MKTKQRRTISSEGRTRSFSRDGQDYKIVIRWHPLDDGTRLHYVHVFKGSAVLPFRWWMWFTTADNEFIEWM